MLRRSSSTPKQPGIASPLPDAGSAAAAAAVSRASSGPAPGPFRRSAPGALPPRPACLPPAPGISTVGDDDVIARPSIKPVDLLWGYFRTQPRLVAAYVILSFYYPLRVLATPHLFGKFITLINGPGPTQWGALGSITGVVILAWAVALAMQYGMGVLDARHGPRFQKHVRDLALDRVLHAYRRNYQELEAGDVLVKVFELPEATYRAVRKLRSSMFPVFLTVLAGGALFYSMHPTLALVYLVFVLFMVGMLWLSTRVLYSRWVHSMEAKDRMHEDIDDFLTNLFTLYITDTVDYEQARLHRTANAFKDEWSANWRRSTRLRAGTTVLKCVFLLAILLAVVKLKETGALVSVASAVFVSIRLDQVLYDATVNYMDLLYELATLQKNTRFLQKVMDRYPAVMVPRDRLEMRVAEGGVRMERLVLRREDQDRPILEGVDLEVHPRQRVLVTGPIGSGKSTLMRLLVGLLPYEGSLTMDGHEVRDMSAAELRVAVTYIPQSPRLFNRTVLENVTYGLDGAVTRAEVEAVLARLAIPNYPALDSSAGKSGSRLSGGQRTIVYLIRAFFRKTPIVILDEPTAALDPDTKEVVRRVVNELFGNRTLFVITHDHSVDWSAVAHLRVGKGTAYVEAIAS